MVEWLQPWQGERRCGSNRVEVEVNIGVMKGRCREEVRPQGQIPLEEVDLS